MIRRLFMLIVMAGMLRLPASLLAQDTLPTAQGVTIHVVQRGENLFRIARTYGVTIEDLARLNGLVNPSSIQVGQRLLVPVVGTSAEQPKTHIILPGETLETIARLYGTTAAELAAANALSIADTIHVGQVLALPQVAATSTPILPKAPAAEASVSLDEPGETLIHTVQPGETVYRIATHYGVTVAEVAAANGISDPTVIYAGQTLIIPGVEAPPLAAELPAPLQNLTVTPLILVEGKTGQIHMTTSEPVTATAIFMDRLISSAPEQDGSTTYVFLLGIPIFTEPGIYPLTLAVAGASGQQTSLTVNIQVAAGGYGSESISLIGDRVGLLDSAVETDEQNLIQTVMSAFSPTRYFDGPMSLPAAATMTSPFGTRRSYNGTGFTRFHSGADFAGVPGTPVLASAAGVVVLAQPLSVRGNATIIDHGWGVYTGYWHQTDLYVQPGDVVAAGQVIGTIGATGRVTGAHLHWELWVSGVPVDPMQWVRQSFS